MNNVMYLAERILEVAGGCEASFAIRDEFRGGTGATSTERVDPEEL